MPLDMYDNVRPELQSVDIRDRLLRLVIKKIQILDVEAAPMLGCNLREVHEAGLELAREGFISMQELENGITLHDLRLNKSELPRIQLFLADGGFPHRDKQARLDRTARKEREQLEEKKLRTDLALAEKMLKDYRYTKFIAWAGLIIALASAIISLFT